MLKISNYHLVAKIFKLYATHHHRNHYAKSEINYSTIKAIRHGLKDQL